MIRRIGSLTFETKQKMITHSEQLVFVLTLGAMLLCFSSNVWLYLTVIVPIISYLTYLTYQYVSVASDQCPWELKTLRYDCQVNNLQNKLSIASNLVTIGASVTFGALLLGNTIPVFIDQVTGSDGSVYLIGFFKILIMYVVLDKIHSTRILTSLYERYSTTLKHITIEKFYLRDGKRFPLIYLDGAKVSEKRYQVNFDNSLVGVTFTPALSLGYDSVVEFEMVREDPNEGRVILNEDICNTIDHQRCFFRCRTVIIPKRQNLTA